MRFLLLNILRCVGKFKKTILLLLLVVLLTFASTAMLTSQFKEPYIAPSPTPSKTPNPTPSSTLTPTAEPTLTPAPILTPTPELTYIPGGTNYSSYGKVYVTGVDIYGGDLVGNQIQWGVLYVGDSKTVSFYVHSASNIPITLSLYSTEWMPQGIGSFLNLYWNYDGSPVYPNMTIYLTLTLSSLVTDDFADFLVSNNIASFSVNIHITSMKA